MTLIGLAQGEEFDFVQSKNKKFCLHRETISQLKCAELDILLFQ